MIIRITTSIKAKLQNQTVRKTSINTCRVSVSLNKIIYEFVTILLKYRIFTFLRHDYKDVLLAVLGSMTQHAKFKKDSNIIIELTVIYGERNIRPPLIIEKQICQNQKKKE